jgi:hydrogenase/urease accessory protein HupE
MVHLSFSRLDIERLVAIDADADSRIAAQEVAAVRAQLEDLARQALEVRFDGRVAPASDVSIALDQSDAVHFRVSFSGRPGARVSIRSTLVTRLARGHRQYLSLRDASGGVLAQRMLDATSDTFDLPRLESAAVQPTPRSFAEFLVLGIEHILTGYDHLLFLLGLLLPGCNLRTAAKIITSFTLAHSITLSLATLDLVWLPSRVVEPMIAVSIAYVGLENVVRRAPSRRWLLTFGFGLVHGFGFASVLRNLGIGAAAGGALVPLFSFNLGVELGQMSLAGLALPVIMNLRHYPLFDRRAVPACSVLVTLAGAYWLIQRTILS